MGAVAVVGPWLPRAGGSPAPALRVVVANVRHGNSSLERGLADVLAQDGDIVSLVEGGPRSEEALRGSYPHVARPRGSGLIVLSRFPVRLLTRPAAFPDGMRGERWRVETPAGPVTLYTVHLLRPGVLDVDGGDFDDQRREVDAVLSAAAAEEAPVLVVGDLNLPDRSRAYRQLSGRFRDAMRDGFAGPTYIKASYRAELLRIDHIFSPRSWCFQQSRRFDVAGSDHRGVAAEVGPCRR
jgi:endonuclease/exonuclease/phosphatase (EEP) superfamily protein YafD